MNVLLPFCFVAYGICIFIDKINDLKDNNNYVLSLIN